MAISDLKFTSGDFAGQDIASLADRPQISTAELKARFDNIGKSMLALGNFNELIDALAGNLGAGEIGTQGGSNVQSELDAKADVASPSFSGMPTADTPPHGNDSTRLATTAFVNRALGDGGYGDMMRAVYDNSGRESDIFAYADTKATRQVFSASIGTQWSGSGPYTQDIAVAGLLSCDTPSVDVLLSDVSETAKAQLAAYAKIGRMTVPADNTLRVYCYDSLPETAINIQIEAVR